MRPFSWIRLPRPGHDLGTKLPHSPRSGRTVRPRLEVLEDRTVLSTLQVVPAATADGVSKLSSLNAALALAHTGDTIRLKPGSAPGSATVSLSGLVIQGDAASAPASLPVIGQVTIAPGVSGTTLTNLNLGTVLLLAGSNHTAITHSVVQVISEASGNTSLTADVISGNTIGGSVALFGTTASSGPGDTVTGNTFTSNAASTPYLFLQNENDAVIQGNTITSTGTGTAAIEIFDSLNVQVDGNIIQLGVNGAGIVVESSAASTMATITNNRISTGGQGEGIYTSKTSPAHDLQVVIAGNDLSANRIGIAVFGDGTNLGTIDAGGGGSSDGGNSFLGFVTTYNGQAGIDVLNATTGTVTALDNQWSTGHPDRAVYAVAGTSIKLTTLPNSAYQYVQSLYLDFLKRTGSIAELQGWVAQLSTIGDQGVANDIIHSTEALRILVDSLYMKYLNRAADPAGEAFWAGVMQGGGTEEQVVNAILASTEMQRRIAVLADPGLTTDEAFVQGLYQDLLHRSGSLAELDSWVAAFPVMGRAGVAGAILHSAEARALQVQEYYAWLHRPGAPAPSETMFWATSPLDLLSIQTQFAGSAEFFYDA